MFASYRDIIEAVGREPLWFDEQRVPRFVPYQPGLAAHWRADERALLLVCCQACRREFRVAFSATRGVPIAGSQRTGLAALIIERQIRYGDPPNLPCCEVGPFTSVVELRVLEYWRVKESGNGFERLQQYERNIVSPHMQEYGFVEEPELQGPSQPQ
jgi:hypothetical protein